MTTSTLYHAACPGPASSIVYNPAPALRAAPCVLHSRSAATRDEESDP